MPVIIRENGIEMSKEAARPDTDRLGKGSNLVLGLATGSGQIWVRFGPFSLDKVTEAAYLSALVVPTN